MAKLTILPTAKGARLPDGGIDELEMVLAAAKDGRLRSLIIEFTIDDGAACLGTGAPLLTGGHMFWRQDGRLDRIHSDCHLLAEYARREVMGES